MLTASEFTSEKSTPPSIQAFFHQYIASDSAGGIFQPNFE